MINKEVVSRRVRKLLRDPVGFFEDSFKKNSRRLKKKLFFRKSSRNNYTVVTAIYNSEKYLDEYFKSITQQSLSFRRNIRIICVDDGSTDTSSTIIKKWQKKFPSNIHYIYQENKGQAAARNLGLGYVRAESDWVTFVDSDDVIDFHYFLNIDKAIQDNEDAKLLSSYIKLLSENGLTTSDKHRLKYRFTSDLVVHKLPLIDSYINLSAASSVFKYEIISKFELKFDEKLSLSFEDAKFVFSYISALDSGSLIYVKASTYFYRKHLESTTAKSWKDVRKYNQTFKYGYINSLYLYSKSVGLGSVVKNTVIYDIDNYFNYLLSQSNKLNFPVENIQEFQELLQLTLSLVDNLELESLSFLKPINKAFIMHFMGKLKEGMCISKSTKVNNEEKLLYVFIDKENALKFVTDSTTRNSSVTYKECEVCNQVLFFVGLNC